jgi:hypothetical protein
LFGTFVNIGSFVDKISDFTPVPNALNGYLPSLNAASGRTRTVPADERERCQQTNGNGGGGGGGNGRLAMDIGNGIGTGLRIDTGN